MQEKWRNYIIGAHFSIATMHGKEQVVAPLFKEHFGAVALLPDNINTDLLGTFSGEIERDGDMLSVARKKCLMAMDMLNVDVGLASEGAFGPHPEWGFIPAATECVLFIDRKNGLEIQETLMTTETNYNGKYIETKAELNDFAQSAGFPSHAVILKNRRDNFTFIHKGLHDDIQLQQYFQFLNKQFGRVFVETDMRAMHNPTRMKMIARCTQKLIEKIKCTCPECSRPGFGVADVITGLPCLLCAIPTRSVLAHVYLCSGCGYRQEKMYPENKQCEDPMYCDNCNP
jgi:hypothetical protein